MKKKVALGGGQFQHDVSDVLSGKICAVNNTFRRGAPVQVAQTDVGREARRWDDDAQWERLAQSLKMIEVPCVLLQTPVLIMGGYLLDLLPAPRCVTITC